MITRIISTWSSERDRVERTRHQTVIWSRKPGRYFAHDASEPTELPSTSFVCSPKAGGPFRTFSSAWRNRIGQATDGTVPAAACGRSRRKFLWRTCSSANTASRSLIGPQGTPAASRSAIQRPVGRRRVRASISGTSASRFATRAGLFANRSSSASSGHPAVSQKRRNWLSLPTARMKWPSDVAKV